MPLAGGNNTRFGAWRRVCGPLGLSLALAAAACNEENIATLVPLFGCDLGGSFGLQLRVQARGDFPANRSSLLFTAGEADLRDLPGMVRAITVEEGADPENFGNEDFTHWYCGAPFGALRTSDAKTDAPKKAGLQQGCH